MAIVQISRIQIRRGLNQDLPQLASAEMGWSVDTQQLYIGNGQLSEGAPNTGVTEILTTVSLDQLTSSFSANLAQLQANLNSIQSNINTLVSNVVANLSPTTNVTLAASSSGSIIGFGNNNTIITYSLNQGTVTRTGTIVATRISSTVYYTDDYVETSSSDITLGVSANSTQGNLYYTTTSPTTFTYSIKYL